MLVYQNTFTNQKKMVTMIIMAPFYDMILINVISLIKLFHI